jgi:dihydroorotase
LTSAGGTEYRFGLLLKGGHVIDPKNGISALRAIAITADRVAAVDASIPLESAKDVLDLAGLVVTPGLADIHTHVHAYSGWAYWATVPDGQSWRAGVATRADAGTASALDFGRFWERVIERVLSPIRSALTYTSARLLRHGEQPDGRV